MIAKTHDLLQIKSEISFHAQVRSGLFLAAWRQLQEVVEESLQLTTHQEMQLHQVQNWLSILQNVHFHALLYDGLKLLEARRNLLLL